MKGVDLSSSDEYDDEGEEKNIRNGFAYSIDSEAIGFEDDLDYCATNRYGEHYARYRARVVKELNGEEIDSDDSENSYEESAECDDEYYAE